MSLVINFSPLSGWNIEVAHNCRLGVEARAYVWP